MVAVKFWNDLSGYKNSSLIGWINEIGGGPFPALRWDCKSSRGERNSFLIFGANAF
jgi:hypothetical protein